MQAACFSQLAGTYTVVSELGRGASGVCYHIVTADGAHCVLKKLPLLLQPSGLPSELSLLSSLSHPQLVRLLRAYLSADYLYLLFPYDGQRDLQKVINEQQCVGRPFPEETVWEYLRQLLLALAYLHGRGVLHRDVKPSNIFVSPVGAVQLGDLGSAKVCEGESYTRVGTPLYLPPEIVRCEGYSEKVDLWSLGVTVFHLAALRPPFRHPNLVKLAISITYEQPVFPAHFSRRLRECIMEMLQKDPKNRPSAQELLDRYFGDQVEPEEVVELVEKESACSLPPSESAAQPQQETEEQPQSQEEEENCAEWNVELSAVPLPSRVASRLSIQRSSVDEDSLLIRAPSLRSLARQSSRTSGRADEIRESPALSRSQLSDGEETIVLQVNPSDTSNFCGYYRESPRPSRVHFAPAQDGNVLRMGRKSSLFKHAPEPEPQSRSHFQILKENRSSLASQGTGRTKEQTHRRQESAIGRQRHGELMSGLRPSRHEPCQERRQEEEWAREVAKPELVVIDRRPLLLPAPSED